MIAAQRNASVMGFNVPAANGAIVRGMRAADISLYSADQKLLESCRMKDATFQKPSDSFHA